MEGDAHEVSPVNCDFCAFRDLNFQDPVGSIPKDVTTLVAIRRANLDAMWAREPETVGETSVK